MDDIRWIEKYVSSIRDDAFDLESSEEYDDSGEELKHVTNEDQCHVEKALTQLKDPVYEAIADGQIEHISKLIKPKKLELQSRMEGFSRIGAHVSSTCDSFDLQSTADSVDYEEDQKQTLAQKSGSPHSVQVHEGMTDIRDLEYLKEMFKPKAVELDPEVDCNRRVDPQVSSNSHDTFDLALYEDILDMEEESKLVSKYNPDQQPMSLRAELAQVGTAAVGVVEGLGRTFEHRRVELNPGMDAIGRIGTQVNNTKNDIFEALPSGDSIDSDQERNLSLVQHSRSPHPETRYKKLTDIWQLEHLENTLEQKGESLDLSMDGIPRIDTRVSGIPHHIMDQQFDQDSFDSDRQLKLDNFDQALSSQLSRNLEHPSFQSVFCLPKYNPPSQTVADVGGALEEAQKQFQLHSRQQSYHQRLRTQEISQTAPSLVMLDMKVSQPLLSNHAQSVSYIMDLLHKLTQTSPEQGSTEMTKEEISQFVEDFKKWRKLLCVTIKDVTLAIEELLGQKIKNRLITNFEKFNLSTKMMLSFKSVLQLWLQNFVTSFNMRSPNMSMTSTCNMSEFYHLLSTRSKIDPKVRQSLEKFFLEKPYPATKDIAKLAKSFNMEEHTVKTWFKNRRHNESVKRTRTGCSIIFPSVTTPGSSTMPVSF